MEWFALLDTRKRHKWCTLETWQHQRWPSIYSESEFLSRKNIEQRRVERRSISSFSLLHVYALQCPILLFLSRTDLNCLSGVSIVRSVNFCASERRARAWSISEKCQSRRKAWCLLAARVAIAEPGLEPAWALTGLGLESLSPKSLREPNSSWKWLIFDQNPSEFGWDRSQSEISWHVWFNLIIKSILSLWIF